MACLSLGVKISGSRPTAAFAATPRVPIKLHRLITDEFLAALAMDYDVDTKLLTLRHQVGSPPPPLTLPFTMSMLFREFQSLCGAESAESPAGPV
mmetsp:Transcript_17835/g.49887  ORF Transcript_17835/g.49887 Transcript_17835/m.49887 type:complete len:95 (-) Transcript_17835:983-1267(-)